MLLVPNESDGSSHTHKKATRFQLFPSCFKRRIQIINWTHVFFLPLSHIFKILPFSSSSKLEKSKINRLAWKALGTHFENWVLEDKQKRWGSRVRFSFFSLQFLPAKAIMYNCLQTTKAFRILTMQSDARHKKRAPRSRCAPCHRGCSGTTRAGVTTLQVQGSLLTQIASGPMSRSQRAPPEDDPATEKQTKHREPLSEDKAGNKVRGGQVSF